MMKYIVMIIFFVSSIANAQEWIVNIEEAKEKAIKEEKQILMVFQGSDWCFPCMKLDKNVWKTDAFKAYAKEQYILLKVDFPRKKKNKLAKTQQEHNNKLAEKYNAQGYFPYVVVLDKNGTQIASTGYKKLTALEYIEHLKSLKVTTK